MEKNIIFSIDSAVSSAEEKVEIAKRELAQLEGATKVMQNHAKSFDSWASNAKEELTNQVKDGSVQLDKANFALSWISKARLFYSDLVSSTQKFYYVKQGEVIGLSDSIQLVKISLDETKKVVESAFQAPKPQPLEVEPPQAAISQLIIEIPQQPSLESVKLEEPTSQTDESPVSSLEATPAQPVEDVVNVQAPKVRKPRKRPDDPNTTLGRALRDIQNRKERSNRSQKR